MSSVPAAGRIEKAVPFGPMIGAQVNSARWLSLLYKVTTPRRPNQSNHNRTELHTPKYRLNYTNTNNHHIIDTCVARLTLY